MIYYYVSSLVEAFVFNGPRNSPLSHLLTTFLRLTKKRTLTSSHAAFDGVEVLKNHMRLEGK